MPKAEAEKQRIEEARKIAEAQKELDDIRWLVEHLKKVNAEIAAENKQEEEMRKRLEAQPETAALVQEFPEVFPACVVTRSVDNKSSESVRKTIQDDVSLEDSFFCRLSDEKTYTKETDTCTKSKENDTNTNTCTHEDKQTHDVSDEAQNVDESELLDKSSLIEAHKDCAFESLSESALLEGETQKQLFDKESEEKSFDSGEVMTLLPIPGDPLSTCYSGLYVVEQTHCAIRAADGSKVRLTNIYLGLNHPRWIGCMQMSTRGLWLAVCKWVRTGVQNCGGINNLASRWSFEYLLFRSVCRGADEWCGFRYSHSRQAGTEAAVWCQRVEKVCWEKS